MPLTPQEQRELDELEFEKLNSEKAAAAAPRRQLATSQLDKDRELLRSEAGRKQLIERAEKGDLAARGNIGLLADIGLEGGGAAAGQGIGALAGPWGIPVGGAIGGVLGNLASQKRRVLAKEQDDVKLGQVLSSALTGAIPGASLESAGARSIAREAVKQGAAGVTGRAIETLVDEGRLPEAQEVAITAAIPAVAGGGAQLAQVTNPRIRAAVGDALVRDATERATLAAGREAGYVLPPSMVNPGLVTNTLESIGGKAAMKQAASLKNQKVTNRIAKEELGIPENQDITEAVLDRIRKDAAKPYEEIAALGAADELLELRQARFDASENYKFYGSGNGGPAALEKAREAERIADALETQIEGMAVAAGRPELVDQLRAARVKIAKTYDVERALNTANAEVSAPDVGRASKRGKPLTGGFETIGDFARAYPSAVVEGAKVPAPGVSALQAGSSIAFGLSGGALHPIAGVAGALAPFIRAPARAMVLSQPYQRFATKIPLTVDAVPDVGAMAARTIAQEAAQELAEETGPVEKEKEKAAEIPTLTPDEVRKAPPGKFKGTNGQTYEKLEDGTIRRV